MIPKPLDAFVKKRGNWRRPMTVCIAALAQYSKESPEKSAIVCVADKAVTLGNPIFGDSIQWDANTTKIVEINPSGVVALESGDDDDISRVLEKMKRFSPREDATKVISESEAIYKECFKETATIRFLDQQMITREEYVAGITGPGINPYMHALAKSVGKYDLACTLLICGFDKKSQPFIVKTDSPGRAVDITASGCGSIGSGSDRATPRMLWSNYKMSYSIERVLYDLFSAKADSELSVGVGYEWDAMVITPTGNFEVPEKIKKAIEQMWDDHQESPFEIRNPAKFYRQILENEKKRMKTLRAYVKKITSKKRASKTKRGRRNQK
jgi:hypothetical protein